jgi:hypothetical protein
MPKAKALSSPASTRKKAAAKKAKKVDLAPEQLARLAAFRAVVKFQRDQWSRMSAQEKREAEEKWELVKKTINGDRAGYRQVFVDE